MTDVPDEEPEEASLEEKAKDDAKSGFSELVAWVGTGVAKLLS